MSAMKHHLPEEPAASSDGRPAKRPLVGNDNLHCFGMVCDTLFSFLFAV